MTSNPAISTTKHILMHASLAYLTDEIQTIDDIIHNPSCSRKPFLPNEILLMIRGWLFPSMTAQLMRQSVSALEAYEHSLCEMLCSDCLAYNIDIYGPDIWNWEQFSCACTPAGDEDRHGHRSARINGSQREEHYDCERIINWPDSTLLDDKHFADPDDWLESHLSNQAARMISRIGRRGKAHLLPGFSEYCSRSPSVNIWEVVGLVLRELDCEALAVTDRGQFHTECDTVQVIPLQHHMTSDIGRLSIQSESAMTQEDLDWRTQAALHLAARDMGLSLKYPETAGFDATGTRRPFINPKFTRRMCWPSVSHSQYTGSSKDMMDTLGMLRTLTSLAGACLTLPITCATLVLTILCFYSKRPLRIF